MRTTDPEPERFKGLGERVTKPAPAPAAPPKPQGKSGIVTDEKGRMSTTTHIPRLTPLEEAVWNWREHYTEDALLDFLP
jgi:hypothetical protein